MKMQAGQNTKILPSSDWQFSWMKLFYNPKHNFQSWQMSRVEEMVRSKPPLADDLRIVQRIFDQEVGHVGESFVIQGSNHDNK